MATLSLPNTLFCHYSEFPLPEQFSFMSHINPRVITFTESLKLLTLKIIVTLNSESILLQILSEFTITASLVSLLISPVVMSVHRTRAQWDDVRDLFILRHLVEAMRNVKKSNTEFKKTVWHELTDLFTTKFEVILTPQQFQSHSQTVLSVFALS